MKRFVILFLCVLLFVSPAWGWDKKEIIKNQQPVVYEGTITGLLISAVDGTAFVDAASAITAYADGNHEISIYDTNGYKLVGVLKAAGSGETLGSDLLSGWDFTSGWSKKTETTITDADTFTAGTTSNWIRTAANILALDTLYKTTFSATASQGTVSIVDFATQTISFALSDGVAKYATSTLNTSYLIYNTNTQIGSTVDVSAQTCQQVTAPSTDGATIVSAKGGTTYNFTSKSSSFTYNAASYKVVVRKMR